MTRHRRWVTSGIALAALRRVAVVLAALLIVAGCGGSGRRSSRR